MGYVTKQVETTRQETRDIGAICDRCGVELQLSTIGRQPMFAAEVRVRPCMLYMRSGATVPPILYCNTCFDDVVTLLPEIGVAIDRASEDAR